MAKDKVFVCFIRFGICLSSTSYVCMVCALSTHQAVRSFRIMLKSYLRTDLLGFKYGTYKGDRISTVSAAFLQHQWKEEMEKGKDHKESKRMQQFLRVLDKALYESRISIDTLNAVEECYGKDAAIFAGLGEDCDENDSTSFSKENRKRTREEDEKEGRIVLAKLIDDMLDRINEEMRIEVKAMIQRTDLPAKFAKLEKIAHILQKKDNEKKLQEEAERRKLKEALKQLTNLPDDCEPMHVINYHAYKVKLEQKEALLAEICSIDAEINNIQAQISKVNETIQNGLQDIEEFGDAISSAADICSLRDSVT